MRKMIFLFTILSSALLNAQEQSFDHSIFNELLKNNVSSDGKVNYKGFINDKQKLEKYLAKLISEKEVNYMPKKEALVFWINAYNAFTIKLIIDNYPLKTIKKIDNPWDQQFFSIEGKKMSLNDIEHQILRKRFNEPRIHFAIVCASFSCPQLLNEAYSSQKIEQQLENQAKKFINDPKRNIITNKKVQLSEIFSWFKDDFTKNGDLIEFLNQYSTISISEKAKISYLTYDWSLNE